MAKRNETKVTFSVFNKDFNEGIKEMNKESTRLRKEFKLQSEQMKDTATATEKLEAKVTYLGKEQDIVRKKIDATSTQLEKAKKTYGENSNEANKLSNKLLDLRISEQKLENTIGRTKTEISKQSQEMQDARADANKYEKSLKDIGREANDLGDNLSKGVTLPLAGVGAAAGASALSLHDATQLMTGTLGATGEEAKQLEEDMQTVWEDGFGDSPEQVARSIMMVKQNIQGINDGKELQEATKHMLTLANVTEADMSEATRGVNQLMHNFGITAEEAMDLFTKGQQEGLNFSQEMFDNISEYAPLFKQMGFSAEDYFSILANGTKNGAYNLDYINDVMKEFDIRVRDGSKRTSDAFEDMSKETQNLFEEFENGEATAEELFRTVLPELEGMEDQVKANQIGVELFGTKWEDMGAKTVYSLDDVNESMKDVDGSMKELENSQEQTFGREFKKTLRGVLDSLEPLGRELLEIAQDVTPHIQELSEWFAELDEDTQKFLLTLAGSAAVAGPGLKTFSTLSSIVGSLSLNLGKAETAAGKKGLEGVLLGLIRKAGPVGLAVGGLITLITTVGTLTGEEKKLKDVSLETANSLSKQHQETGKMIQQFDELRNKSKLTSDEFGRYIDLQHELQQTSNPETIAAIKKEMATLKKKSGFTNDELQTMVGLNAELVESLPGATEKITDQGNKIAGATTELRKYNQEISKMATLELEKQFFNAADNQSKLLEQRKTQQRQLNMFKTKEAEINQLLNTHSSQELQTMKNQVSEELKSLQAKQSRVKAGTEEWFVLQEQIKPLQKQYDYIKDGEQGLNDQLLTLKQQKTEQQIKLSNTDKELSKLGMVYEKLQLNYLKNAGISEEVARQAVNQGNVSQVIDEQISKLEEEKQKLKDQTPINMRNTDEYLNGVAAIDGQIDKLYGAESQIQDLASDARNYTDELGRDVSKNVRANLSPSAYELNSKLSETVWKTISLRYSGGNGHNVPVGYAGGTNFHPGGPAFVGEEGPELVREGNKWSLHGFGLIPDLKRGADVFTAEETKKILSRINSGLPAYASGVGVSPEISRNLDNMSTALTSTHNIKSKMAVNVGAGNVIMDREIVGEIVWEVVQEHWERDNEIRKEFRGE
ncbi:phage tail tape measure protein, TP901 family, core region [Thalassobacillus cyri]|uniref:Phage tail tape measure protein, TP901 family, core region n=1 Tax=Thalassobacillus cyri TaxID=571932 RepID=A0A1H4H1L0_9BACI|nr:phage tail tape measure protein [Thalassobacillus cyri]SEB15725.1 phage tail tape measure protein, TP901 family, core region [Thalassobacillus cyri]